MGKPTIDLAIPIAFSGTPQLKKIIEKLAEHDHTSYSDVIRQLMFRGLGAQISDDIETFGKASDLLDEGGLSHDQTVRTRQARTNSRHSASLRYFLLLKLGESYSVGPVDLDGLPEWIRDEVQKRPTEVA